MPTKILIENKATEKPSLPESAEFTSTPQLQRQSPVTHLLPRSGFNLRALTKNAVLQLQRVIGNRAVGRLLAKSAKQPLQRDVSKPDDKPAKPEDKSAKPESETGLPDNLKSGIENLSGLALDDVRVHYNSPEPARLNALAYARGTDIYLAPDQERHLPHEAWHVVQQRQGRVRAIAQVGGEPLNDNPRLEQEADEMGERALRAPARVSEADRDRSEVAEGDSREAVVQLAKADIHYSTDNEAHWDTVEGDEVGQGGEGGVSHSEQTAWEEAEDPITTQLGHAGRHVIVEFSVDTPICTDCATWFEDTVYPALTAARGAGSTFLLRAEVNGNQVEIRGANTIWTPEVADAHTFERLSAMERSMRYLRENRQTQGDTEGRARGEARSQYLVSQLEALQDLLDTYQYNGLRLEPRADHPNDDSIEARLTQGKQLAVNFIGEGVYDTEAAEETLAEYLDTLSFADIMFSGQFAIPDLPEVGADDDVSYGARVTAWYNDLEQAFRYYMVEAIQDHFEDYRVALEEVDNPHHR